MRTVGIDLAAEPTTTAVAVIDWQAGGAQVTAVQVPADDDAVLLHTERAEKVGIDCPLGWPDNFVEFVGAHRDGPTETHAGPEWRRSLAYRRTDEHVRSALPGLIPLSVATDRIGLTAMHRSDHAFDAVIAVLLARAAALGLTTPPDDPATAATEGWIALPTRPLADLITPGAGRTLDR